MGDQTFDYDAVGLGIVVTPDGFKEFFDVKVFLESYLTCELLANDCTSSLVGTEADGTTPLTTGPHISMMDQANSFKINAENDVVTGFEYDACVKCTLEAKTPSNRIVDTLELTHTLTIKQNAQVVDCSSALVARSDWETTYVTGDSLCFQQDVTEDDYFTINPSGWSDFFTNSNPTACPIDSCQVRTSDCAGNI